MAKPRARSRMRTAAAGRAEAGVPAVEGVYSVKKKGKRIWMGLGQGGERGSLSYFLSLSHLGVQHAQVTEREAQLFRENVAVDLRGGKTARRGDQEGRQK